MHILILHTPSTKVLLLSQTENIKLFESANNSDTDIFAVISLTGLLASLSLSHAHTHKHAHTRTNAQRPQEGASSIPLIRRLLDDWGGGLIMKPRAQLSSNKSCPSPLLSPLLSSPLHEPSPLLFSLFFSLSLSLS